MALPTSEVGGDYEIWRVCKFSEEKNIIQEKFRKKENRTWLKQKKDNLLDNRKYTSIKQLLNVVKLCLLLLICSANFKSSFADICVYIYTYIHILPSPIHILQVGVADIDVLLFYLCSQFPSAKMRTDLWLKIRWVLPAWRLLREGRLDGLRRKQRVDLIGKQQREHSYCPRQLKCISLTPVYGLWKCVEMSSRKECEWLYLPIVRWHFQEIIRSRWNISVPIVQLILGMKLDIYPEFFASSV